MALLQFDAVEKEYRSDGSPIQALEDIDFSIEDGEFFSIIGPTGCGKSTLLEIIAGLITPSAGSVAYRGEELTSPHPSIGIIFQEDSTFPWRTTLENVEFGLELAGVDPDERRERSREMIDLVGLSGFENSHPDELSGGMRQRVSIARTLVTNPDILLMDEPFGALDEQTRLILGQELLTIWNETGTTIVFVTHSITEATRLSDRMAVMTARPGRIKEIVENPLQRPRSDDIVNSQEFNEVTSRLWELLRGEAVRGMEQAT